MYFKLVISVIIMDKKFFFFFTGNPKQHMSCTVLAANCPGEYLLGLVGNPIYQSFYFVLLTGHQLVYIHLMQVNCCY